MPHLLRNQPLTPPCVLFGTRLVQSYKCRDSYRSRMLSYPACASLLSVIFRFRSPPNILCACSRLGKPANPASPVSSGSSRAFEASSTVFRCTSGNGGEASPILHCDFHASNSEVAKPSANLDLYVLHYPSDISALTAGSPFF